MDQTKIIGYRVQSLHDNLYLKGDKMGIFFGEVIPDPMSRSEAYRLAARFFEENDGYEADDIAIVPVYAPVRTPVQSAAHELGEILQSLVKRHGVKLDMTQEQIERQLAIELMALGASPE